jgi:hypothetical protein
MQSVEAAYMLIANTLARASQSHHWKYLIMKAPVFGRSLGGTTTIQFESDGAERDLPVGLTLFDIQAAALYLRDDLLRTTGQRIWGLTFTLYPSGKFNIEYDYDKPEGYEESDETIELGEALKGLGLESGRSDSGPE